MKWRKFQSFPSARAPAFYRNTCCILIILKLKLNGERQSKENWPMCLYQKEEKNHIESGHILGRRLALWLCKDLMPFKVVENKGFRDLWTSLHFGIALPSRKTLSVAAIDDMYSCMKKQLVTKLLKSAGTIPYKNVNQNRFIFPLFLFLF